MPNFKNKKAPNFNMKEAKIILGIAFLFTLVIPFAHAAGFNYVIANSEKWTDVYSGIMYANLQGIPNNFLISTSDGNILLAELPKNDYIRVLSSTDQPYVLNYPATIKAAGFAGADEISGSNLNLQLANDLPNITNFIVVSDSFGYNAIAVAPYALLTHSWVFLANPNNIYQIDSILSKRTVNSLLVYGYVDPSIDTVLAKYHPQIINTGDRFDDNIAIVNKYMQIKPTEQVILTNGEFLEQEVMSGTEPVLFTGQQNVPSQISSWLKNSSVKVGVLIGNNLVNAATNIRATTGISVFVKFARSARDQTGGGVAPVQGLTLFPVPTPTMDLILHSVDYNSANSQLYVTYQSQSNIPIYMQGTVTVSSSGNQIRTGDLNPVFVTPGEYKTMAYPISLTPSGNMTAQIYALYGETPNGLEDVLSNTTSINMIQVIDPCKLDNSSIQSVDYNKQEQAIFVKIKNPASVACWATAQINNIQIGFATSTIGTNGAVAIPPGKVGNLEIKQALSSSDIQNNPYVDLSVFSGEKEDSLVNTLEGQFPLHVEALTTLTYSIIAVVIVLLGMVILLIILRKNKKEYY